ncbi:hypothetical protein BGX21_007645 [Mortierella sp. AD011]|nr:hypothetical protein BGX21_007645 [Mortierella sp. AD011]
MFVTLEKLLMGMSPFPPTIPNLAKPTCPPLKDQTMTELSSPSSSPSSASTSEPAEPYTMDQFYLKQEQPSEKNHYQHQHGSDCSTRSVSPTISPYNYDSPSPTSAIESGRGLPYWSPSTPSLHVDRDWSNSPSPLLPSQRHQPGQSSQWGYPLFDQVGLPLGISDLSGYVSPSDDQDNSQSQQNQHPSNISSSAPSSSNIIRRAARATNANPVSTINISNTEVTIRGGVKSYPCPTCTKPFPTRTQLKSHMAIHIDNFPFPCLYSGCDLHFKRKHDLRRHVDAKHALVKKYLCASGCGEGFGRRDQMVRHLRKGNCARSFHSDHRE